MTDRLFLAVLPDEQAVQGIASLTQRLREEHDLRGRPLIPGRLHISLLSLGDHASIPEPMLAAAEQLAAQVTLSAFPVTLDRALTFGGRSPLPGKSYPFVLRGSDGATGLVELQRMLMAGLPSLGIHVRAPTFTPHLTLLYDQHVVLECDVPAIDWVVQEFVLVHSRIGSGAPYRVLRRWSLPG